MTTNHFDEILQCSICEKRFSTAQGLRYHLLTCASNEKPWACLMPSCDRSFVRKSYLINHLLTHSTQKPYQCQLCGNGFAQPANLYKHGRTVHCEKISSINSFFRCNCSASFVKSTEMAGHFRRNHTKNAPIECPICKISLMDGTLFSKHVDYHFKEGQNFFVPVVMGTRQLTMLTNKLICNDNHKIICTVYSCSCFPCENNHSKMVTCLEFPVLSLRSVKYSCDLDCFCADFESNAQLLDHLLLSHSEFDTLNMCPKCGHCFALCKNFLTHVKSCLNERAIDEMIGITRNHSEIVSPFLGKKGHCCKPCRLAFSSSKEHLDHFNVTHNDSLLLTSLADASFACSECDKYFDRMSKLEAHMKLHRITIGFAMCSLCRISFKYRRDLDQHIQEAHSNDLPFQCLHCGKRTAFSDQLRRHVKIHNKRYQCAKCDRLFAQKCEFSRHIVKHTFEIPYQCAYCDRKFRYACDMKRHLKRKHILPSLIMSKQRPETTQLVQC